MRVKRKSARQGTLQPFTFGGAAVIVALGPHNVAHQAPAEREHSEREGRSPACAGWALSQYFLDSMLCIPHRQVTRLCADGSRVPKYEIATPDVHQLSGRIRTLEEAKTRKSTRINDEKELAPELEQSMTVRFRKSDKALT